MTVSCFNPQLESKAVWNGFKRSSPALLVLRLQMYKSDENVGRIIFEEKISSQFAFAIAGCESEVSTIVKEATFSTFQKSCAIIIKRETS